MPLVVKNDMNAAEDFYTLVWEAHITTAAMTHCKLSTTDSPLCLNQDAPSDVTPADLKRLVGEIVDRYAYRRYG